MITIREALSLLNQFDGSHLNRTNQQLLATAKNRRTVDSVVQSILDAALGQAKGSPKDSLDYPETLLNCAAIEFERGFKDLAKAYASEAKQLYKDAGDSHGKAIALWILGIAEVSLLYTDPAWIHWKQAIQSFTKQRDSNKHIPETRDWYMTVLLRTNEDLVTLPQEGFSWLNRSTPSRLTSSNRALVNGIEENIKLEKPEQAYKLISILKEKAKSSTDPLEYPEIFVEIGVAYFRLKNPLLAMQELKVAVGRYSSSQCHQRNVSRWLLGAVQWWLNDYRLEAQKNWETSLDGFAELAKKADQKNQQSEKFWYRERIIYMKGALQGKIKEYFS